MIESIENRLTYKGDGKTTEFPVTFPFLEKEDVVVATVSPGNQVNILTGDYFLDAEKGAVIYPGYPPGENPPESEQPPVLGSGWKLVIYRDIRITQEVSLGDRWPFNVTEYALDKLTLICQDLSLVQRRSLRIPESISDTFDPTLPDDLKPGDSFMISDDGTHIVASDAPLRALSSAEQAADSAEKAEASEGNAASSAEQARLWAESGQSPDGESDVDSPTAYTMSSKSWALQAKESAEASDRSAKEAADSENSAANSELAAENAAQRAELAAQTVMPGAYNSTTVYNFPDVVVMQDGSIYRCTGTGVTGEDPPISNNWAKVVTVYGDFFDLDTKGGLMPAINPIYSNDFDLDESGDIMPKA